MRWIPKWQWSKDSNGDTITQWRRVFAWLPTRIGNQCIWLEHYEKQLHAWGWGFVDTRVRLLEKN